MIVFIAQYPDERNERDGMMQRVAAIDTIFASTPRRYLDISFWKNRRRSVSLHGMVTVEHVNFFLHHHYVFCRLKEANWIFIHSALNAVKVVSFLRLFRAKTIFDVHGVVPEETRFVGAPLRVAVFQIVERLMVRDARLLIFVTRRMQGHFIKKYPHAENCRAGIILPNLHPRCIPEGPAFHRERAEGSLRLVYAGGAQKWQNIDLMLKKLDQLASRRRNWRASIFLPQWDLAEFRSKLDRLGCRDLVEVASLPHDELIARYEMMDAGFVLRNATLLNEVAMPTKLVEYLLHGVVPIVLSADLGDFVQYGYQYLTLRDLLEGRMCDSQTLEAMRRSNFKVLASIRTCALESSNRLAAYCGLPSMEPALHT